VIHVRQVAQLVHYYIVLQSRRQLGNTIIKPKVAAARASAPPRARVADKNLGVDKAVMMVKVIEPLMHERACKRGKFFKLNLTFSSSSAGLPPDNPSTPDNGKPRHCIEYNKVLPLYVEAICSRSKKVKNLSIKDLRGAGLSNDEIKRLLDNRKKESITERLRVLAFRSEVIHNASLAHRETQLSILAHSKKDDVKRSSRKK
jgi:hypothetical protein